MAQNNDNTDLDEGVVVPHESEEGGLSVDQKKTGRGKRLYNILGLGNAAAAINLFGEKNAAAAARTRHDAATYSSINEFFAHNAAFSEAERNNMQNSNIYKSLNSRQKKHFDHLAKRCIAANTLIEKALDAQEKSIQTVEERNKRKLIYAKELRKKIEENQNAIDAKIKEAEDHINNNRYKEALNTIKEADALLYDEKGGLIQGFRKTKARIKTAITGNEKDVREYNDVVVESYHNQLMDLKKSAEDGLKHQMRKEKNKPKNENIPEGEWTPIYSGTSLVGFEKGSVRYELFIKETIITPDGKILYIVKQSRRAPGDDRFAICDQAGNIDPDYGFFLDYDLLPESKSAGERKNISCFVGKIMIKKEKNGPAEYIKFGEPVAPTATPTTPPQAPVVTAPAPMTPPAAPVPVVPAPTAPSPAPQIGWVGPMFPRAMNPASPVSAPPQPDEGDGNVTYLSQADIGDDPSKHHLIAEEKADGKMSYTPMAGYDWVDSGDPQNFAVRKKDDLPEEEIDEEGTIEPEQTEGDYNKIFEHFFNGPDKTMSDDEVIELKKKYPILFKRIQEIEDVREIALDEVTRNSHIVSLQTYEDAQNNPDKINLSLLKEYQKINVSYDMDVFNLGISSLFNKIKENEGEEGVKLLTLGLTYFKYPHVSLDQFLIKRERDSYRNYAHACDDILKEYPCAIGISGIDIDILAFDLRKRYLTLFKKLVKAQDINGPTWAYWDIAKQYYFFSHPETHEDQERRGYRVANPMNDADKEHEIVDRMLGWAFYDTYHNLEDEDKRTKYRKKFLRSYAEGSHIEICNNIKTLLDKDPAEGRDPAQIVNPKDLASKDLTKLGELLRKLLTTKAVPIPDPESVTPAVPEPIVPAPEVVNVPEPLVVGSAEPEVDDTSVVEESTIEPGSTEPEVGSNDNNEEPAGFNTVNLAIPGTLTGGIGEIPDLPAAPTNLVDLPLGQIEGTDYEVREDGVYFEGNFILNPMNLTYKELIKFHINGRKEETLKEAKEYTPTISPRYIRITNEDGKINDDTSVDKIDPGDTNHYYQMEDLDFAAGTYTFSFYNNPEAKKVVSPEELSPLFVNGNAYDPEATRIVVVKPAIMIKDWHTFILKKPGLFFYQGLQDPIIEYRNDLSDAFDRELVTITAISSRYLATSAIANAPQSVTLSEVLEASNTDEKISMMMEYLNNIEKALENMTPPQIITQLKIVGGGLNSLCKKIRNESNNKIIDKFVETLNSHISAIPSELQSETAAQKGKEFIDDFRALVTELHKNVTGK